jgi:hypothetical protein
MMARPASFPICNRDPSKIYLTKNRPLNFQQINFHQIKTLAALREIYDLKKGTQCLARKKLAPMQRIVRLNSPIQLHDRLVFSRGADRTADDA